MGLSEGKKTQVAKPTKKKIKIIQTKCYYPEWTVTTQVY